MSSSTRTIPAYMPDHSSSDRALGIVGRLTPARRPRGAALLRADETIPETPAAWFGGLGAPAKIGAYQVLRKLSTDDVSSSFLAQHDELGHRAVVRILHADRAIDEAQVERLCTAAIVGARVTHPGIARVLDYGRHDDGAVYLITEHLDGETLAARLAAAGPLPERRAAAIGAEIAEAMASAHAAGVVHRALSPDAVFLARATHVPGAEHVKLLDFAAAAIRTRGAHPRSTASGPIGAPGYTSPEQRSGPDAVDARTDIYSLGALLFAMVCGAPPYAAAPPALSPPFERLITSMLAGDPARRPPTMTAIAAELARIARGVAEHAPRRRLARGSIAPTARRPADA